MPKPTTDLSGARFGRWVVVSFAGVMPRGKSGKISGAHWNCVCDCGVEKVVQAAYLKNGGSQSCGCRARDMAAEIARAQGIKNAKNGGSIAARQLYARYKNDAKRRALDFCLGFDEAMELFQSNCAYCGEPPRRTNYIRVAGSAFQYNGIDRINNSKGYEPENCAPSCLKCNEVKRAMTLHDFRQYVKKLYTHLWEK